MKIAFLILAHHNPNHLNRLIKELISFQNGIYIHVDKKTDLKLFNFPQNKNVYLIKKRLDVKWGGFSTIYATLNLINAASKKGYDYYALLSGADYPTQSIANLRLHLENNQNKEFINLTTMPNNNKSFNRFKYYIEYDLNKKSLKNIFIKYFNKFSAKFFPIRKFPYLYQSYIPYAGSQWWTLSNGAVNYIKKFIEANNELVTFYKKTLLPDEMIFHTILGNSEFKKNITTSLTFSDWSLGSPHPNDISMKHFIIFKNKIINSSYGKAHIFFARKFNDNSEDIIKKMKEYLVKN